MIGLFGIDSILDANEDKPICLELHRRRSLPCISLGIILVGSISIRWCLDLIAHPLVD